MTVWIVEEHFEWEGSEIELCDMRTFTAKAYVVDDLTRHDD